MFNSARTQNSTTEGPRALSSPIFVHSKPVNQRRDDRFRKVARHAHHCRIFFIEEIARVVGKLILSAKDKVLIVIEHSVLNLVAHCHGRDDCYFEDARAPAIVEQYTGKGKALDHAVNYRVGAFAFVLHSQTMTAANQLFDYRVCEPVLDLE